MNQTNIMKAIAVVAALFGVALLLMPNGLMAVYKAEQMNSSGVYNSMLCGAYLIAIAIMNWTASTGTASQAKPVILGTFAGMVLGLLVAVYRQLTVSTAPAMGWLNVVLFLVFTGLLAYLQFGQKPADASPATAT